MALAAACGPVECFATSCDAPEVPLDHGVSVPKRADRSQCEWIVRNSAQRTATMSGERYQSEAPACVGVSSGSPGERGVEWPLGSMTVLAGREWARCEPDAGVVRTERGLGWMYAAGGSQGSVWARLLSPVREAGCAVPILFCAPPLYSRGPIDRQSASASAAVRARGVLHMRPRPSADCCTIPILCSFQIPQRPPGSAPPAPTLCLHPSTGPYVYRGRTVLVLLFLLGLLFFLRPVLVVPLPRTPTPPPLQYGPVGKPLELARARLFPGLGKHRGAPESRAFIVRVPQHDLRYQRHGPLWHPRPD